MTMLVCFTKYEKDNCSGKLIDTQYHVFTNCKDRISFVHDSIFKCAINKGYTWSAIPFIEDLAWSIGFTISDCESGIVHDSL